MQQIVWIGSSSIRTVRTFVPEPGIPGILGVRVTAALNPGSSRALDLDPVDILDYMSGHSFCSFTFWNSIAFLHDSNALVLSFSISAGGY